VLVSRRPSVSQSQHHFPPTSQQHGFICWPNLDLMRNKPSIHHGSNMGTERHVFGSVCLCLTAKMWTPQAPSSIRKCLFHGKDLSVSLWGIVLWFGRCVFSPRDERTQPLPWWTRRKSHRAQLTVKNVNQTGLLDVIHIHISQVAILKTSVRDRTALTGYVTHSSPRTEEQSCYLLGSVSRGLRGWITRVITKQLEYRD